ncbi:chemotaxis protein MotB [Pseudomonas pohangensis]|uniref:Chemotaxis protein MotB n=1 Tax=Pseudomonas pohangensis TaxID=364197 RepID=A0A1H2EDW9_9PSED|nr:OmpA family protein [Pseudomonas pohangensis]SDT93301.1 chemotaxis protein MotB [Pseudomonas pohangensis]
MKKSGKKICFGAAIVALVMLGGCVSKSDYDGLQQEYDILKNEFNADQAQITLLNGELKVTMVNQVLFPEGGYRLSASAREVLAKLVPSLSNFKNTRIVVDGYTDNVPIGPELQREGISSNLQLSSRRADGVVEYLVKQGVNPDLISAQGFGEAHPVASNQTAEGRAQNRRIEVTLVGPGT